MTIWYRPLCSLSKEIEDIQKQVQPNDSIWNVQWFRQCIVKKKQSIKLINICMFLHVYSHLSLSLIIKHIDLATLHLQYEYELCSDWLPHTDMRKCFVFCNIA